MLIDNMTRTVNIQDAKTHLSHLIVDMQNGVNIVIAKRGKPIAKLEPLDIPKKMGKFNVGWLKVKDENFGCDFLEPMSEKDLQLWEGGAIHLSLLPEVTAYAGMLRWDHRDPFDRMIAAAAIYDDLTLITCDRAFYGLSGLKTFW